MTLLNSEGQKRVSKAIRDVELKTNAELVAVLAAASDDYRYIPTMFAAIFCMFLPGVLYFLPVAIEVVVWLPVGLFVVLVLVLQLSMIRIHLIPKSVAHWRASNMARRQFLDQQLHHTVGDTGILIFVSEAEHYVEIMVDRGISEHVDDSTWVAIVDDFVSSVRSGHSIDGFVNCISACGDVLAPTIPKTPDNHNELDDRLILIGYD